MLSYTFVESSSLSKQSCNDEETGNPDVVPLENKRRIVSTSNFDLFLLLMGSSVLIGISMGISQSFGVIYTELLEHFHSGKGETSWIASLSIGLLFAFGPVSGVLLQKFGCRVVAITGSIAITVGMVCSAFVSSLYLLYLTYGIICGVGFNMLLFSGTVIVPLYFSKRRTLAMTVTSVGGSVSTLTIPILSRYWLEEYRWRGTFILMAGISLQGVVFAALVRERRKVYHTDEVSKTNLRLTDYIKKIFHLRFCIFTLSGFFVLMAYFMPYVILPDLAKGRGVEENDAALIISVAGISGLVGRIFVGLVAQLSKIDRCLLNGTTLIFGGLATIGCSFIFRYTLFLAYSAFFGIFTGIFGFMQPLIIADFCETYQLSIAYGFLFLINGIAVVIGPPIAGWIADVTGRYDEAFYYGGSLFILGGSLSVLIPMLNKCALARK